MNATHTPVLGIDIGGSKIALGTYDSQRGLFDRLEMRTPAEAQPFSARSPEEGRETLLKAIITQCRAQIATHPGIRAIGIGTAGQVDTDNGVIVDANENLVGWKGTPLAETLRDALNLPIFVDNDVRTMALAEYHLGAARGYDHVLCLTVGTGIGGAIILNGELWRGAHFSAGEIGYIFGGLTADGRPQTIEERYGGAGLERTLGESLRAIAQRAHIGDPQAAETIAQAAQALGERLAPVIAFLDPQVVVVGGGIPQIGPLWRDALMNAIHEFRLRSVQQMPILYAALGPDAGLIGAALLAQRSLERDA